MGAQWSRRRKNPASRRCRRPVSAKLWSLHVAHLRACEDDDLIPCHSRNPVGRRNENHLVANPGDQQATKTRALLYHDLAMHERMQAADVGKSPRLVKLISKCLVGIEYLGTYPETGQKDTVRNIVLVGPGHLGSLRDG